MLEWHNCYGKLTTTYHFSATGSTWPIHLKTKQKGVGWGETSKSGITKWKTAQEDEPIEVCGH